MQRMIGRRALVALAVVTGLLALSAGPTVADAPASFSGVITVGQTFPFDSTDPPVEGQCPGERSIDAEFASTSATAGTWALTGAFKSPFQLTGSSTWYQAAMTILASTGGTYAQVDPGPPPVWALSGRIDVQAVIQSLGAYPDCGKTDLCTVRARVILDSSTSTHTGSLPTPGTGDVTHIEASSNPAPPGVRVTVIGSSCPPTIASALVGQHGSIVLDAIWP